MPNLDDFIEECLREHNAKRVVHNAPPLKHSRSLDKSAQDWAEQLISEEAVKNSPLSGRGEVGESISMRTSTAVHVDILGSEVVDQWYADIKNYNFAEGKGPSGNFTQLIWHGTREVGFGKARAGGKCIVVAHYRPPGNVRGRYQENVLPAKDRSSTGPGAGDMRDSQDSTKRSVVEEKMTKPDGKSYTIRREIVETTDSEGRIKRCVNETYNDTSEPVVDPLHASNRPTPPSPSAGQLDEFGTQVTDAHNSYRRRHGVGDLNYDRDLSKIAQAWADQLVNQQYLSNSGSTYQGIRLGENVFSRWSNASAKVTGHEMVDHWYQEKSKYKFGAEPSSIQGIGSFTQLVWAGSQRLGVGMATQPRKDINGSSMTSNAKVVVVCMYYPPGNVTGQFRVNVKPATT